MRPTCALQDVGLVDAVGVDPDVHVWPGADYRAEDAQNGSEFLCCGEGGAVDGYGEGDGGVALYIGEGEVGEGWVVEGDGV